VYCTVALSRKMLQMGRGGETTGSSMKPGRESLSAERKGRKRLKKKLILYFREMFGIGRPAEAWAGRLTHASAVFSFSRERCYTDDDC
jgi:hypothetical protein